MLNNKGVYGYMDNINEDDAMLYGGPSVAGFPIGIIALEVGYPLVPGNVVNGYTYKFPVRIKVVKGCTTERIFRNDRTMVDDFIAAAKELQADGCRAITCACGFFANYQTQLQEAVDIPVFASAMLQAPWIKAGLKPGKKIGVISANGASLTPTLYKAIGIDDPSYMVVAGLEDTPQFGAAVRKTGFDYQNSVVREEAVAAAVKLAEENDLGAILLECSDLPPYSADIQRAVHLPVFDFITMVNWVHNAVAQRPYCGFM